MVTHNDELEYRTISDANKTESTMITLEIKMCNILGIIGNVNVNTYALPVHTASKLTANKAKRFG